MANQSVSETENRLRSENEELQQRLTEAEETLYAIRNGEVDAIIVSGAEGARIFSLTSAETPYRIMVEEMHEGAATLMADMTIIHCNSQFAKMVARPAEQIMGASFSQLIGENEKPAFIRLFNSGLAEKSSGEITWLSPENEVRYFHLSFSPLPSEVTGDVCVIVSDFTERKQAEETMHAHVFLNSVIENSPNALWILDEQGNLNQMNQASRTLFSLHDEEVTGKYNILNDPVFEKQGLMSLIHDVFEKASMVRFVARYDTASGRGIQSAQILQLDLDVSISPILNPHGKVTNAVVQFTDITDSKLAEEALKLSGERYRFSLESTGQIGWSTPPDGVVDDMPMWREYSGQSLEEVAGWKWLDAVHPDDRESAYLAWSTAAAQKINYFTEYRIRRADGVYRNFMVRGIPLLNTDGSCKEWVGTCIDITESKKTEQELRESERKFKNLVWDMPVGVLLQGPQSEMLLCNPKALELLGLTEDQLLGKTSFDPDWNVIHEDGSPFPGETHPVPQAIATGLPVRAIVMGVYHPVNHNRVWLLVDAMPQLNADGNVQQVVCSFIDISKRKQAEEVQKQSEVRYRSLLTNLEAGIVVHAPDTSIIMNNPRSSELLGLSDDQMKGRLAVNQDWKFIHPDGVPLQIDEYPVNRVISSGKAFSNMVLGVIQPAGKTLVWLTVNGFPAYDDRGEISEVIISFIDITQRKQAEEAIQKWNTQFKKLSANAPGMIFQFTRRTDGSYCIPIASEGIRELYGCSPEDVLEDFSPIAEFMNPDDIVKMMMEIEQSAKNLTLSNFEFRVQLPGKAMKWLLEKSIPEKLDDGTITWYGFTTDITQQKQSEADLQRKMDELLQFQRLTVGRELKMIELKKEINELLKGSGKDEKYRIVE
ncbi:MAG: PAS domain S-box protein [Bacteroidia bacterium]